MASFADAVAAANGESWRCAYCDGTGRPRRAASAASDATRDTHSTQAPSEPVEPVRTDESAVVDPCTGELVEGVATDQLEREDERREHGP